MTISTTRNQEFTIDQLVALAYRRAGLLNENQPLSEARLTAGRQSMQMALQMLEADGLFIRTTVHSYLQLAAATQDYQLDSSIANVVGPAQYLPPGEVDVQSVTEHAVMPISIDQWAYRTPKNSTGIPTTYWLERATMTLWLDPIPDAAGRLRMQAQVLRASCLDGSKTPDAERWWSEYLVWKVASDVGVQNGRSMTFVGYADGKAQGAYQRAAAASRQGLESQFYVARYR